MCISFAARRYGKLRRNPKFAPLLAMIEKRVVNEMMTVDEIPKPVAQFILFLTKHLSVRHLVFVFNPEITIDNKANVALFCRVAVQAHSGRPYGFVSHSRVLRRESCTSTHLLSLKRAR